MRYPGELRARAVSLRHNDHIAKCFKAARRNLQIP
jgi:hypothetical protein